MVQGLGGVDLRVSDLFSLLAEYRLSYGPIDADLVDGGTLSVEPWTRHLVLGVSFTFGR